MRLASSVATLADLLRSTPTGAWFKVESWTDFINSPGVVESPAGVWTFNIQIFAAGTILAPVGARIVGGEQSLIFGVAAADTFWIFDVDGPAISGPLILQGLTIVQLSAGSSAKPISMSTGMGRAAALFTIITVGGRVGVETIDCSSPIELHLVTATQADTGFVHTGAVSQNALFNCGTLNMNLATSVSFEVDSAAVLSADSSIKYIGCAPALDQDQHAFAFSHSASITFPALLQVSGGAGSGPAASLLRQTSPGVTDMAFDDDRLVIKGNNSIPDWRPLAIASRDDPDDPIEVVVSGAGADNLIPYEDALGNLEITASTESHFILVKGAPATNWHFQYTGPTSNVAVGLGLEVLSKRTSAAGPSVCSLKWQRNPAPGFAAWADVPNSAVAWSNGSAYTPVTGSALATAIGRLDLFRPVLVNRDDAGNIDVGFISSNLEVS